LSSNINASSTQAQRSPLEREAPRHRKKDQPPRRHEERRDAKGDTAIKVNRLEVTLTLFGTFGAEDSLPMVHLASWRSSWRRGG
jgi:hypothetical protein